MDAVVAAAGDHKLNQYGSGAGLPALVKALKHKLAIQNGLEKVRSICTTGTWKQEQPSSMKAYVGGHEGSCHPAHTSCPRMPGIFASSDQNVSGGSLTVHPLFCLLPCSSYSWLLGCTMTAFMFQLAQSDSHQHCIQTGVSVWVCEECSVRSW